MIRISELLSLEMGQLETLLAEGWISIDRLKRGSSNHKAFLTWEVKKLVKDRKRDFAFLFLMKSKDSYVFISDRKLNQMLSRQTIDHRNVNSTSSYVTVMDDEERKNRIFNIKEHVGNLRKSRVENEKYLYL